MAIVRDRPRQLRPARRQLFLSEEQPPVPDPTLVGPRPARAIIQFLAVAGVLAVVGVVVVKSFGGAPPVVDPLRDAGVGDTPQELRPAISPRPDRPAAAAPAEKARTNEAPAEKATAKAAPSPAAPSPAAETPPAEAPAASPSDLAAGPLADLAAIRRNARSRLARAKTAEPQAAAATELAAAYGDAAGRIERLGEARLAGLAAALRSGEQAYTGLAAAIAGGDQRAYDRERGRVGDAEADVARESARLR
jgi:hypothetical protein